MTYSKMRFYKVIFIVLACLSAFACAGGEEPKPSTPLNTLEAYANAFKKKDLTAMKLLLSDASLKMAEQQAKAQNTTVDEIVKNETLFTESQTTAAYRNQKIDGERATVEVRNSFNGWDTVAFVQENGAWKIDKQGIANQMLKDSELKNQELEDKINQGRIP